MSSSIHAASLSGKNTSAARRTFVMFPAISSGSRTVLLSLQEDIPEDELLIVLEAYLHYSYKTLLPEQLSHLKVMELRPTYFHVKH